MEYCEAIINRIEQFNHLEDFQNDDDRVKATAFDLSQIGEFSKYGLSDDLKNSLSSIPWNAIYGLRNRIVRGYEGITLSIVWHTVTQDISCIKGWAEKSDRRKMNLIGELTKEKYFSKKY